MESIIVKKSEQFLSRIINYVNDLLEDKSVYHAQVSIPADVLCRSELICKYISAQENEECLLDLGDFVKILYSKFIQESVESYSPEKVFKMLSTRYFDTEKIILSNGTDECVITRNKEEVYSVDIYLPYSDVENGELILREIYELYRYKFSFKTLLEQLWLKFIYEYKTGKNKKAMKELKVGMEEYLTRNYPDD